MEPTFYLAAFVFGCVLGLTIYLYVKLIDCCARTRITYEEF